MKKKLKDRRVTIVVHTDGELASRQYRVPLWAFEAGKWGALIVGLLVVLFFAFAGPISRAAARVPGLEREVARLEEENAPVWSARWRGSKRKTVACNSSPRR